MGDHFVLLVDRLLTESTLEASIQNRDRGIESAILAIENPKNDEFSKKAVDFGDISSSPRKLVECKICHDDDDESNMETPCSCSGSLKYAHRKCVQRWCNEKGDTKCEICHQQFTPGYTAPAQLFRFGRIPMHFRGNWEIARRDMNSPRFIAMVSNEQNFINPEFDETSDEDSDDYTASNASSLTCCRSLAIIFIVLLVLRHTLPLVINAHNDYSLPLLMILFLRTIGIVLPIYVVVRAVAVINNHRNRNLQVIPYSSPRTSSDPETEQASIQLSRHRDDSVNP